MKKIILLGIAAVITFAAENVIVKEETKVYNVPLKYQNVSIDELDKVGTLEKSKKDTPADNKVFSTNELSIVFFQKGTPNEQTKKITDALKKYVKSHNVSNKKAILQLIKLIEEVEQ